MKVLLTRPDGQNQELADALTQKGIDFVISPLLVIKPISPIHQNNHISESDMIIFVSANAVNYANALLNHQWPKNVDYFAIGHATWKACKKIGITAKQSPEHNQQSEGLLSLAQLQSINHKKIVIVRGIGGRELLKQTLQQKGAEVHYWEVYQRQAPPINVLQCVQHWQQANIDTIFITSSAILDNLVTPFLEKNTNISNNSALANKLFSWLQACHIIVSSERAQDKANNLGFSNTSNANGANTQAMLAALNM